MMNQEMGSRSPKVLIFDLETSPILGYVWGLWEQNVIDVVKSWHIMSVSYSWLDEDEVHVISLPDFKTRYKKNKDDDFELVAKLRNLFDEADIVVAHNGDEFDVRKSNARFIAHGMTPPSPYAQIDTKKMAKRYFRFDSNSLDNLGEYLGLGRKKATGGFSLWKRCMAGDMDAWHDMCEYNKQDVVLLKKIYNILKPWHKTHPNVSSMSRMSCTKCNSVDVQRRGMVRTGAGVVYQRIQCNSCGGWSQARKMVNKTVLK